MDLVRKLGILAPLEQAERCLARWLAEENASLPRHALERATALIARHFAEEGPVPDDLILSFLRHYSGRRSDEAQDPARLRRDIAALLRQAKPRGRFDLLISLAAAFVMTLCAAHGLWIKATPRQQAELQSLVREVVALEQPNASYPAVWAEIKKPLHVRSYQEMTWRDYRAARSALQKRLEQHS